MTDVEKLIQKLGWKFQEVSGGNELLIKHCPYCGKEDHFYVNRQTGRFFCQHGDCHARGGTYQLQVLAREAIPLEPVAPPPTPIEQSQLDRKVELWHRDLWNHDKALDYLLNERKFSRKAIKHFKLGICKEYDSEWIVFPHIYKGSVTTLKYRRLDKKQFRHLKGTGLGLYHQDAIDGSGSIIVCEGEPDCVSLWSNGFRSVVATPGAGQWKPEWMDMFARFEKIHLCFDQDDAGKLGAKELAKRLGYDRCYNVNLPIGIKDVNDYFMLSSKGRAKFKRILERARQVDVPYVIKAADSIRDVILKRRVAGDSEAITTPWEGLNDIITGVVPESVVIITSYPGVGKSTAALQWLYHLAQEGRPVGYVCIEMSSEEMTNRLLSLHTKEPRPDPEQKIKAMQDLGSYPFYWIDLAKHGSVRFDILADTLRDAVLRYDLKIIAVDHMHFMVRSLKYQYQETGQLTQKFKLLARELGIPIICIAHVTKPVLRDNLPKRLVGSDIRDSGLIYGDSDYIFILHRKPIPNTEGSWDGEWEDDLEIGVFKSRHSKKDVIRGLKFFGEIGVIG
jgi:twinkle protein